MAQTRIVRGVKTSIRREGYDTIVNYRGTDVVRFSDTKVDITLKTGGWKSATTKLRMNQASNQFNLGYYVFQKKGEWYVNLAGNNFPFVQDTFHIYRQGR